MTQVARVLDVVALTVDLPEQGLRRGQVGTVVELFGDEAAEVEFMDEAGRTYALCAIPLRELLVLHYRPERVA
jgi:hypothetical protein